MRMLFGAVDDAFCSSRQLLCYRCNNKVILNWFKTWEENELEKSKVIFPTEIECPKTRATCFLITFEFEDDNIIQVRSLYAGSCPNRKKDDIHRHDSFSVGRRCTSERQWTYHRAEYTEAILTKSISIVENIDVILVFLNDFHSFSTSASIFCQRIPLSLHSHRQCDKWKVLGMMQK